MRQQLERVSRRPSASVRLVERVQIVLLAAEGLENIDIASRLDISRQNGESNVRSISSSVMSDFRSPRFQLLHISHRASQTNVQW